MFDESTARPVPPSLRRIALSIDVPDLDTGLRSYGAVFGLEEVARPFPEMAVLDGGNGFCILGAS